VLREVVLSKRGLVIVVGGTGSGKSTTLAAMVGYRNEKTRGHIVTIEDPVEYVHPHRGCVITHREVGVDTDSWQAALKNTLRQAPDVILIGEIRDHDTMEYALNFAETGHLCMATLHANSANQAIDRIVNFFPIEKHEQVRNDLALNMRAIISQRLVRKISGGRAAAIEILLSTSTSRDAIAKGEVGQLKEIMKKSYELGMKTFDQCLFELYEAGDISLQELQVNSDAKSELMLRLKLNSKRFIKEELPSGDAATGGLSLQPEPEPEEESTGPLIVHIKKPEPKPAAGAPAPAAPVAAAKPPPMELSLEEKPAPPPPPARP
jgi:twitching motility protein PilU